MPAGGVIQRRAKLSHQGTQFPDREYLVRLRQSQLSKRHPIDQFHRDSGQHAVAPEFVDAHDVRMRQRPCRHAPRLQAGTSAQLLFVKLGVTRPSDHAQLRLDHITSKHLPPCRQSGDAFKAAVGHGLSFWFQNPMRITRDVQDFGTIASQIWPISWNAKTKDLGSGAQIP